MYVGGDASRGRIPSVACYKELWKKTLFLVQLYVVQVHVDMQFLAVCAVIVVCGRLWLGCGAVVGLLCLGLEIAVLRWNRELLSTWSGTILLIQCVLLLVTILPVEGALKRNFDRDGHRIAKEMDNNNL